MLRIMGSLLRAVKSLNVLKKENPSLTVYDVYPQKSYAMSNVKKFLAFISLKDYKATEKCLKAEPLLIYQIDSLGRNALFRVCKSGDMYIFTLLCSFNPNFDWTDIFGKSCLRIAIEHNQVNIIIVIDLMIFRHF